MASTSTELKFENELVASVDLISKVAALLESHPAGGDFRLMIASQELQTAPGDVLVQSVSGDGRVALVVAKPADELADADVLADTLRVGTDVAYLEYLHDLRAASCLTRTDVRGNKVHIYD